MARPTLTADLTCEEFEQYYFLKDELKDFLRSEGLKVSGSKGDLERRICHYLDTGEQLNEENSTVNVRDSPEIISPDSKIGNNFRCSEDKREFFKKEIGKEFKFKVAFQKWLKSNPEKTYHDAVNAYFELENSKEKTEIGKQFQYNQYIRDFFEDNENMTLKDAIECWNYKKSIKGHNKYEKKDLEILN